MTIESKIVDAIIKGIEQLYSANIEEKQLQLQKTRKDFEGDITCVVFPFLRYSRKSPEQTAQDLGDYLKENLEEVTGYSVLKGFLNISISTEYWINVLVDANKDERFGFRAPESTGKTILVEYSSPNTNKPLHLGHIRNNVLGYSVYKLLVANGHKVIKTNIVNDRGIHICKSMLAWMKYGEGETPESTGMKGDHLIGKYYVLFDKYYKEQISKLIEEGKSEDEAKQQAPMLLEAQDMLRKWEAGDDEIRKIWKMMNEWVYAGFDETYERLGVDFDKIYYESDTYLLGKDIVLDALKDGLLIKKEDNSVWADLTSEGLDQKILLRSDGTSVYMTQDIGTAVERHKDFNFDKHYYIVGNEQDYHFKVLSIVLNKMGYSWADAIEHVSYGMVELPHGKMKSREGTVVDADDLMTAMETNAKEITEELGKLGDYSEKQRTKVFHDIAMAALKYFILKVDPKKNMTFNPEESIDFNGNTGPFIQYTYARIQSVLRNATEANVDFSQISATVEIGAKEKDLLKTVYNYPALIEEAGNMLSPALVANYTYDLVKEYNQFYHDCSILKEENEEIKKFRLMLSKKVGDIIKSSFDLLGINVPERM